MNSLEPTIRSSCCNVNCDRSNLPHLGCVGNFKPALSEEFHTGADT
jgi:hypothetical protein